jgi:hypothetical protein
MLMHGRLQSEDWVPPLPLLPADQGQGRDPSAPQLQVHVGGPERGQQVLKLGDMDPSALIVRCYSLCDEEVRQIEVVLHSFMVERCSHWSFLPACPSPQDAPLGLYRIASRMTPIVLSTHVPRSTPCQLLVLLAPPPQGLASPESSTPFTPRRSTFHW